jgi:hypothetical protein
MLWSLIIFWIPWRFVFIVFMSFLRRWISASISSSSFNGALSDPVTSIPKERHFIYKRTANSGFKYIANIGSSMSSPKNLLHTYETSFPPCKWKASVFTVQRQISHSLCKPAENGLGRR